MHFYLDHVVSIKLQFVENFSDDAEHGTGFRGNIAEHFQPGRKISRDQSGKVGVVIVQHHLAERCL